MTCDTREEIDLYTTIILNFVEKHIGQINGHVERMSAILDDYVRSLDELPNAAVILYALALALRLAHRRQLGSTENHSPGLTNAKEMMAYAALMEVTIKAGFVADDAQGIVTVH